MNKQDVITDSINHAKKLKSFAECKARFELSVVMRNSLQLTALFLKEKPKKM